MTLRKSFVALLGATALSIPALAQEAAPPADAAISPDEAAAQIEFLQAQVEAMQAQLDQLKKATKANTPNWKAAPEFSGEGGLKFKVRGRLMYDVGYVTNPDDRVAVTTLGFNSRTRRIRLGVEGGYTGGWTYKAEMDFANSAVGYGDVYMSYAPKDSPFSVTIGNFDTYQNLEQPTSSRYITFLERAQMNEGFDNVRRLGIGVGYHNEAGKLHANAGLFNDRIRGDNAVNGTGEGSFGNSDWLSAVRVAYTPQWNGNQLHFGANWQHRTFQRENQTLNYQNRPTIQTTDVRFVSTGGVAAKGDDIVGAEFAGIFKSLHVTGEVQQARLRAIRPGQALAAGEGTTGTRYAADPTFVSYYVEAGYWLTGETRGYKEGSWARTKVLNPFDKGGWGAWQVSARYDMLDLTDRVAAGTAATAFAAPNFVNGGKQEAWLFGLNWQPIDYIRFTAQYSRLDITGGPRAAAVVPVSTLPAAQRDYSVNVFGMRAAFDF
jgi:phosphate-selective porin OprO/OprP